MLGNLFFKQFYCFSKLFKTPAEAIGGIKNGSFILAGGFGLCGVPMNLINAIRQAQIKDLVVASDGCGRGDITGKSNWGLGILLPGNQIKRMILSFIGTNKLLQHMYINGQIEVQLVPQGTLAQKIRSGGAGIPAFYTKTGAYTDVQNGKIVIKYQKGTGKPEIFTKPKPAQQFNGKRYIREETYFADYALIKAQVADTLGNLYFSKTARNFNADMATAAQCVIAEVQQIVQAGKIPADQIHVPAIYVDRIYKSDPHSPYSKKIVEKPPMKTQIKEGEQLSEQEKAKIKIMKRAAKQVKDGMNVNLGIGIPLLLPAQLPNDIKIHIHCQNGVLQVGPYAMTQEQIDPDLINPGKEPITVLPGASYFSSSTSFSIIRGHHLDITMLGALQASSTCDIANWIIPGKMCRGMGGAMDLVASGSKVIVVMTHYNKNKKTGKVELKFLDKCSLPLTAKGVITMVITQLGVFQNRNGQMIMTQIASETTLEQVQKYTGFTIKSSADLKVF